MAEGSKNLTLIERLSTLDRRWIFLLIALAVIIPLIVRYTTSIPTSPLVQRLFDKVEEFRLRPKHCT
jgi:hypothetical protein